MDILILIAAICVSLFSIIVPLSVWIILKWLKKDDSKNLPTPKSSQNVSRAVSNDHLNFVDVDCSSGDNKTVTPHGSYEKCNGTATVTNLQNISTSCNSYSFTDKDIHVTVGGFEYDDEFICTQSSLSCESKEDKSDSLQYISDKESESPKETFAEELYSSTSPYIKEELMDKNLPHVDNNLKHITSSGGEIKQLSDKNLSDTKIEEPVYGPSGEMASKMLLNEDSKSEFENGLLESTIEFNNKPQAKMMEP